MDLTRDTLCSLIRKWHTLIETQVDVKTPDGYIVRLFAIAFTEKRKKQVKKTCYAQTSQIKAIRAKITELLLAKGSANEFKELVKVLITDTIGDEIKKATSTIFPLQNARIRKVKVIKRPRFDVSRLLDLYKDVPSDTFQSQPEDSAAENLLTAELKE
jgi:small subunit ribosomal protein S3Ae